MFLYLNILKKKIYNSKFIIISIITYLIISISLLIVESNWGNEWLQTWFDMVWFSVVTWTTVWYWDVSPITTIGKLLWIFQILNWIVIFWLLINKATEILNYNKELFMSWIKKITNKKDTVLIQWLNNEHTYDIIKEVNKESNDLIIVMPDTEKVPNDLLKIVEKENVFYISKELWSKESIDLFNINNVSNVYLLDVDEDDSKNMKSIMNIRKHNNHCNIITEASSESNRDYLLTVGANDVINTNLIWNKVLVKAGEDIVIPKILRDLVSDKQWFNMNVYTLDKDLSINEFEKENKCQVVFVSDINNNISLLDKKVDKISFNEYKKVVYFK